MQTNRAGYRFEPLSSHIGLPSKQVPAISFTELTMRSSKWNQSVSFPTALNRIRILATEKAIQEEVEEHANNTRPLITLQVFRIMERFLKQKCEDGSDLEKKVYTGMDPLSFITRLLQKRPVVFMGPMDHYMLKDGTRGIGNFEKIGTEAEGSPLTLKEYISYEEMPFSALISVSAPSHFINDGRRSNKGCVDSAGTYEQKGVYVGMVGPRFEKPGSMEWKYLVVTPQQNRYENGYGKGETERHKVLQVWARFYGHQESFPLFGDVEKDESGRYFQVNPSTYLDIVGYKKRITQSIEPFLVDANSRGKDSGRHVYVMAEGIGLGVWRLTLQQKVFMLEVYADLLKKHTFQHIHALNLSRISENQEAWSQYAQIIGLNSSVDVLFSPRESAAKLMPPFERDLLVTSFAWDGNSYVGNEYWQNSLDCSSDPVAASCSTIPELLNPMINPFVSGESSWLVVPEE